MSTTCRSGSRKEDYNLSLSIGALFIILAVSASACALPIIALKVPQLRIPAKAHFGFRHFGTGVLIATAFVHLIPTAFVSLTDPCLPPFFNQQYPALAGAIALAAIFMITIAEMIFSPGRSLCSGISPDEEVVVGPTRDVRSVLTGNPPVLSEEITPGKSSFCFVPSVIPCSKQCTKLKPLPNLDALDRDDRKAS